MAVSPIVDTSTKAGDIQATPARGSTVFPWRDAVAEGEDAEPVGAGAEGVRLAGAAVDEAVAGADLVDRAVLPGEAGAPRT